MHDGESFRVASSAGECKNKVNRPKSRGASSLNLLELRSFDPMVPALLGWEDKATASMSNMISYSAVTEVHCFTASADHYMQPLLCKEFIQ